MSYAFQDFAGALPAGDATAAPPATPKDSSSGEGHAQDPKVHAEIIRLLQTHFAEIQVKRPEYSHRAFARLIGVTPAQLSEMFSGKRPVTRKIASRVFERLGVDAELAQSLIQRLPARQTRESRKKKALTELLKSPSLADVRAKVREDSRARTERHKDQKKSVLQYTQLSTDEFRIIADWYHFAILSLAETKGFKGKPEWIATRLNISARDAKIAIERLIRLGLLTRKAPGKLVPTGKRFTTTHDIPDASIRRNHAQGLELARDALDRVPIELRDIAATILAIDPRQLPKAKERLREIRREITQLLEGGEKREVYRLSIQLFPLTQIKWRKKSYERK